MSVIMFTQRNKSNISFPPDADSILLECIRDNPNSRLLIDACLYFPRLEAVLQNISRHILDIPYEEDSLINKCISSAINASLVMKTRPFLLQGTEDRAYISILNGLTMNLRYLHGLEVSFLRDGMRTEWNPLDVSIHDLWIQKQVSPVYHHKSFWKKVDMSLNVQQFMKILLSRLLTPRDFVLFCEQKHMKMEFI